MRELVFEHITNGNEVYMDCLELMLGDTPRGSFLDMGCNLAPHTPLLGFKERKYVDILPRKLDHSGEQQYFKQGDILATQLSLHYDVTFANDVIEHLTIDNGIKLLKIMQAISDKRILFTPLDDIFGFDYKTDDPEAHRSLWKPEMIEGFSPNTFIFLTFPNYHKIWNGGAFFFYSCKEDIDIEFERIKNEITKYSWANNVGNT